MPDYSKCPNCAHCRVAYEEEDARHHITLGRNRRLAALLLEATGRLPPGTYTDTGEPKNLTARAVDELEEQGYVSR